LICYLLDTNILSEPTRLSPHPGVLACLKKQEGRVATAAVVWHELLYGCRRLPVSRKRQKIENYLQDILTSDTPILPYNQQAADWHAEQRAHLSAQGKTHGFSDSQIAAIAKTNDLILVTRNIKDFEDFADLQVENWFEKKGGTASRF
jgi:tRNA(fMet)-specific endonuclease VapC